MQTSVPYRISSMLVCWACACAEAGLPVRASAVEPERVLITVGRTSMVQPLGGGQLRQATIREMVAAGLLRSNGSEVSPNGRYRVVFELGQEPRVVRTRDGKTVIGANSLRAAMGDWAEIGSHGAEWTKDSQYLFVPEEWHARPESGEARTGLALPSGRRIAFCGWIDPTGRYAIVPSQESPARQGCDVWESKTEGREYDSLYTGPDFYIVKAPVEVGAWSLQRCTKRLIAYDSQPLHFSLYRGPTYSSDGNWAIIAATYRKDLDEYGNYLVHLPSGSVRRLAGTSAKLIRPSAPSPGARGEYQAATGRLLDEAYRALDNAMTTIGNRPADSLEGSAALRDWLDPKFLYRTKAGAALSRDAYISLLADQLQRRRRSAAVWRSGAKITGDSSLTAGLAMRLYSWVEGMGGSVERSTRYTLSDTWRLKDGTWALTERREVAVKSSTRTTGRPPSP